MSKCFKTLGQHIVSISLQSHQGLLSNNFFSPKNGQNQVKINEKNFFLIDNGQNNFTD